MIDNLWELIEEYRKLGFDPLRGVSSCTTEVDRRTLRNVLSEVKRSTIKISSSWFDPYLHIEGKEPELTRRIFDLVNPVVDKEVEVKRALALFRVHASIGESSKALAGTLQNFLSLFNAKITVSSSQVALTEHSDAQFALFDYISLHRGNKDGYMPALTAFTQITDVTQPPDSEIHAKIAIAGAIEKLGLLGCGNPSEYKFFPIYDAPTDEMLDKIRRNLDVATARHNLSMEDYSSLKRGKLFYGTTAFAITHKELPTLYDQVEEGMGVMVTNKFGGLAAVSMHIMTLIEPAYADRFENGGVSVSSITRARDEALKSLSEPRFALGKIVAKYCPDFGSQFDKQSHISAVYPVGASGLFAIGDVAELVNASITVNSIPVRDEEIAKLATQEYVVENATASQNGCHIIVASKDVLNLVAEDLSQHHFSPEFIGTVGKKGMPSVEAKDVEQFVASKNKLARLVSQSKTAS